MLKRFFIICSGADQDLIYDCANGEQNKYAGIGATVFFTALMAAIAGSYALYTVFDNYFISIGFGIVWGLLIFNLDRFIVSTLKKRNNILDELLQASPRIALAIIIAIVIAKPLELKLFEKEIDQVLLKEKNELTLANKDQIALQFSPKIEALTQQKEQLQQDIVTKTATVDALYDTYIAEAEGRKGTKLLGKGPVYKEKRDKHDAALAELQQLKTTNAEKEKAIDAEIASLQTNYEAQVTNTQPIIDKFDGLMARVNALGKLPWLPSFFIFLLFLAVETSPILAKLLSPRGEYDLKLENEEQALANWVAQQANQRKHILKTDNELNDRVYQDITEEEEIYDYKRKKARTFMQLQTDAFFNKQKRLL